MVCSARQDQAGRRYGKGGWRRWVRDLPRLSDVGLAAVLEQPSRVAREVPQNLGTVGVIAMDFLEFDGLVSPGNDVLSAIP